MLLELGKSRTVTPLWPPCVPPSAGSAREEAPQLQPMERTTPGQEPCTAQGPSQQTRLELAEKGCQGRVLEVLRLHLCYKHTLLLWFCAVVMHTRPIP